MQGKKSLVLAFVNAVYSLEMSRADLQAPVVLVNVLEEEPG